MVRCCRPGLLLIVLVALFAVSCVVHDKFPFICFRSGCVKQAYNLKGFKKRINGQLALKARKRDAARAKNEKEKNANANSQKQAGDSQNENELSYASKVVYSKFFLRFYFVRDTVDFTDSVIIFYTSEHRDITEADKPRLEHFIKKLPANKVTRVDIRQIDTNESKEDLHLVISRQKKI